LTTLGLSDAKAAQKNIAAAVQAGLEPEAVLRALTIAPAQYLGVDDVMGSLEPGKIANVVLARGEIFGEGNSVELVFSDGIPFKLTKPPAETRPQAQQALNLAGSWRTEIKSPMGDLEATMELEQEGNKVKGVMSSQRGKWEIREGVLSGSELTFVVAGTMWNQYVEMAFTGKADKETIEGTIATSRGTAQLRATRLPKAVE
jgi:adenine deaminase